MMIFISTARNINSNLKCTIELDGAKKLDIFPNDPDSRSPLNNNDIDPDR